MDFYLIGIDYKSAPIEIREDFYRRREGIAGRWLRNKAGRGVMLSTCNRFEIYGSFDTISQSKIDVEEFKSLFSEFARYAYVESGYLNVFKHALRLACGLESQLQGELESLSQLYAWNSQRGLHQGISDLWNEVLPLAGEIRAASGLALRVNTIADVVFYDLNRQLKTKDPVRILIVGTGKIARIIADNAPSWARLSFFAHKNYLQAITLAERSNGDAFTLSDLPRIISSADALISATTSPHYVLGTKYFTGTLDNRKAPLYIYDLAMPRDVEPDVRSLGGVVLKDMSDLSPAFDYLNRRLQDKLRLAASLIEKRLSENSLASV